MAVKKGLGKGLDTLIPKVQEEAKIDQAADTPYSLVSIDLIEPNANQPRRNFDEDALNELAESIKIHGVMTPLLVQRKDDYYKIIAGERRWRASKMVGLTELPVIIKDLTDQEFMEWSLIENLQREDLNPIEEAMAYKNLLEEFNLKQDQIAERVGKSRSTITNSMRLLNLDPKVQKMLAEGMINIGHARPLLGLPEGINQVEFAERIFDEQMSARDVEKAIKAYKKEKETKPDKSAKKDEQFDAVLGETEERLKNHLATKVKISSKDGERGTIEIEYYSREQLSEIVEKLEA